MTPRDYDAIAIYLSELRPKDGSELKLKAWQDMVKGLADRFAKREHQTIFDRPRFLAVAVKGIKYYQTLPKRACDFWMNTDGVLLAKDKDGYMWSILSFSGEKGVYRHGGIDPAKSGFALGEKSRIKDYSD